jgi:hypothetical protein
MGPQRRRTKFGAVVVSNPSHRVRRLGVVAVALSLLFALAGRASGASAAAPASPYTPLILHINATTTIALTFITQTGTGNCPLVNSGSDYVGADYGTATKTTATSCAAYTAGTPYVLSSDVGVEATCTGTCTSFDLSIGLATPAQTNVVWQGNGTTLTTTQQTLATGLSYNTVYAGTIAARVTANASTPTNIQDAIVITATAAGVTGVTTTATANIEFSNQPGISIFFTQDPGGVAMTGGAFAAAINFGTVSAYAALPAGVTRPTVTATNFTVATLIDITVDNGGIASTSYTLQSDLAAAAPTGLSYKVNAVPLTTTPATITTTGAYTTATAYTINIIVNSAASGSGGPAIGSALTDTLNFTATSN